MTFQKFIETTCNSDLKERGQFRPEVFFYMVALHLYIDIYNCIVLTYIDIYNYSIDLYRYIQLYSIDLYRYISCLKLGRGFTRIYIFVHY